MANFLQEKGWLGWENWVWVVLFLLLIGLGVGGYYYVSGGITRGGGGFQMGTGLSTIGSNGL